MNEDHGKEETSDSAEKTDSSEKKKKKKKKQKDVPEPLESFEDPSEDEELSESAKKG